MKMEDIEDLLKSYESVDNTSISFNPTETKAIRIELLKWYHLNRRKLPWRGDNIAGYTHVPPPSAYGTWISEIMLQQTRVETVIPYWFKWMAKYPTVESLSMATPEEVNGLWAGLGYYRRVQQILLGAKNIVNERNMIFPSTVTELLQIPGIGPYTAGAISSIAFHQQQAAVDGNVIRVLSRLRAIEEEMGGKLEKLCWTLAESLVDPSNPGDFNQAMMELGATVCKPTSPLCDQCPVNLQCHAKKLVDYNKMTSIAITKVISKDSSGESRQLPIDVTEYPHKKKKNKPREIIFAVCVFSSTFTKVQSPNNNGSNCDIIDFDQDPNEIRYLVVRRPATGLLANQWEFPNKLIWEEKTTTKSTKTKSVEKKKTKSAEESSPSTEISDVIVLEDEKDDITSTSTVPQFNAEQIQSHVIEMLDQEYAIRLTSTENSSDSNHLTRCYKQSNNNLQTASGHLKTSNPKSISDSLEVNKHRVTILKDSTARAFSAGSSNATFTFTNPSSVPASKQTASIAPPPPIQYHEPLTHIFSHQKHIMYLFSKHVHFVAAGSLHTATNATMDSDNSPPTDAMSSSSSTSNDDESNILPRSALPPLHWCTRSANREIRWMTLKELKAAGVTSGVQKILSTVTLPAAATASNSNSNGMKSSQSIYGKNQKAIANKSKTRSINNSDKVTKRKEVSSDSSKDQKKFKQTTIKF